MIRRARRYFCGFRSSHFLLLRRRLAEGALWGEELVEEVLRKAHGEEALR